MYRHNFTTKLFLLSAFVLVLSAINCRAEPIIEGFGLSGNVGRGDGNDWAAGGIIGRFGEKPAKIKPIVNDNIEPQSQETSKKNSEYDFSVDLSRIAQPAYVPVARVSSYDLVAKNKGYYPVTVVIDVNQDILHTNTTLPFAGVIPPKSDKVLFQVRMKAKNASEIIPYKLFWQLGSYNAQHNTDYNYQLPSKYNVKAFASVDEGDTKTTTFTKYAVVFTLPPKTDVLAARNGFVARINKNSVDIVHDDLTIATYSHVDTNKNKLYEGMHCCPICTEIVFT